ncbi:MULTISPECIES: hypothetical protein [unclassified Streptococcus]|uniref:hypothetical protein n=1 Tax=unclassified Streptococcus TaxID=2608887 RepID=UPI000A44C56A|nr:MULTISPECIES: hypothetical protein [unclassified Streptococcus]
MKVQKLSYIVMLSALSIVLRVAFGAFPNIKPLTAVFLISLCYLPLVDSLLIMALTMVGSGFFVWDEPRDCLAGVGISTHYAGLVPFVLLKKGENSLFG